MRRDGWRRFLSPSMGVAFLALGVALGGTSYAVTQIDPRSVGNKQLKRNAVAAANLRANAVTARKVRDDSLTGADINEGTLGQVPLAARAAAADSAATAAAATRAAGADLATVATGLERVIYRVATGSVNAAPNDQEGTPGSGTARCDTGQLVIGGGVRVDEGMAARDSHPDGSAAWSADVENNDPAASHSFSVFAICVPANAVG